MLAYYVNRLLGYYMNIMRPNNSRNVSKLRSKTLTAPNCSVHMPQNCPVMAQCVR